MYTHDVLQKLCVRETKEPIDLAMRMIVFYPIDRAARAKSSTTLPCDGRRGCFFGSSPVQEEKIRCFHHILHRYRPITIDTPFLEERRYRMLHIYCSYSIITMLRDTISHRQLHRARKFLTAQIFPKKNYQQKTAGGFVGRTTSTDIRENPMYKYRREQQAAAVITNKAEANIIPITTPPKSKHHW